MPRLNDVKGVAEKPKKKAAKEVPSLELREGLVGKVAEYNQAADSAKTAQGIMDSLSPMLVAEGLAHVFSVNCRLREDTKKQIKSVNLVEPRPADMPAEQQPEALQFTWSTRALKCDAETVKAHFAHLETTDHKPADVNKYAQWVIGVEFDKKALCDSKGRFMQTRFDKFRAALDVVAQELGIDNPLTFYKEFKPTPELNDVRFKELDVTQNLGLHLVLPTSTSLEPVRSNGDDKE